MFSTPAFVFAALAMLTLVASAFLSPYIAVPAAFSLGSVALYCMHRRRRYKGLYRQICQETMRLFYDRSAFNDAWRESYLGRKNIKSEQEFLLLAQTMLDSLRDRHTRVQSKREVEIEASLDAVPDITFKILKAGIGYLKISQFGGPETANQALHALAELRQTKAIIIDLRDNPGGQLRTAMQITSLFLETGKIATIRQRLPGDPSSPIYHTIDFKLSATAIELEGRAAHPLSCMEQDTQSRLPFMVGGKQLVVLVNESSASASELMAGALKDNRAATVIGTQTYGKGTGQSVITLKGGAQLTITTMEYFTPKGLCPGDGNGSGSGIVPDIVARQEDREAEEAKGDTQLQKALNHLSSRGVFHSLPAPFAADISLARILGLLRR